MTDAEFDEMMRERMGDDPGVIDIWWPLEWEDRGAQMEFAHVSHHPYINKVFRILNEDGSVYEYGMSVHHYPHGCPHVERMVEGEVFCSTDELGLRCELIEIALWEP